jgi:periplasmic divalent cation tolerance protein
MSEVAIVYVPVPNAEIGARLGTGAVELQLAACANLLSPMQTFFESDGVVCNHLECPLVFKTHPDLIEELEQWILNNHPYDCPCILRVPPVKANNDFVAWMNLQLLSRVRQDFKENTFVYEEIQT